MSLFISLLFWIVCGVGILCARKIAAAGFPGSLLCYAFVFSVLQHLKMFGVVSQLSSNSRTRTPLGNVGI